MKRVIGGMLVVVALTAGVAQAGPFGPQPLVYDERHRQGPILVFRGEGCLQTEDSTTLELVDYTSTKVVFRCVGP